jgi:hypothetical protein
LDAIFRAIFVVESFFCLTETLFGVVGEEHGAVFVRTGVSCVFRPQVVSIVAKTGYAGKEMVSSIGSAASGKPDPVKIPDTAVIVKI